MVHVKQDRSGFTLIELLIVVIIVAVLAGVGVPMLSANVQRAKLSEADAGLGTIRTGLRAYFAEHRDYSTATMTNIGLSAGDMDGRYFDDSDFSLAAVGATTYCVAVTGGTDPDTAPKASEVNGLSHSMNQDGTIFESADCT